MPDDDTPTAAEVSAFLADLRSIDGRLARFEDIPADELAEFEARKREIIGRIERAYESKEQS